jgi:GDPmannose 4,6-dehydratase
MVGHMRCLVKMGDIIVKVDPSYLRPAEVETLLGNPAKAKAKLGWVPEITVEQMCAEMVANELDSAKRHALLMQHGHNTQISIE